MSEFTFEPGQMVLVRERDCMVWLLRHFSHTDGTYYHTTTGTVWPMCIPFNDDTKHLLGTNKPYIPPVDEATRFERGEEVEIDPGGGNWMKVIYLEHKPLDCAEERQHRVYDFQNHVLRTLLPSEIRKKQAPNA